MSFTDGDIIDTNGQLSDAILCPLNRHLVSDSPALLISFNSQEFLPITTIIWLNDIRKFQ
jgi:hypothetical protein